MFELCPCPCLPNTRSWFVFKLHTVYDLPDQKRLSVDSVDVQTRMLGEKKMKTDQGLQMLRVLRVLLDIEKRLEGAHSGQTLGKKGS